MSAEVLSLISLISYVVAGVCLALAVLFWFVFKIPMVVGDLTGRNARKSIARMRTNNENSGIKSYRSSEVNVNRGKLTDTMQNSKELKENSAKTGFESDKLETGLLDDNKVMMRQEEQTALLVNNDETGLLSNDNETMLLQQEPAQSLILPKEKRIEMIEEVIFVHTAEVI